MTNAGSDVIIFLQYAPVVELADTLDLGSSARAWGFKSLLAHQNSLAVITTARLIN